MTASLRIGVLAVLCWASSAAILASERPNVLLIVSDDQRPDTIRALGNQHISTPNLDRLVREGTVFRRATCGNPLCVPSRAELLSGMSSFKNGFYPSAGLRADLLLWPHVMQRAGYVTGYVGKWHTRGKPESCGYSQIDGLFVSGQRPDPPQLDRLGKPVTGYVGWQFQSSDGKLQPDQGVGLTPDISRKFADAAIRLIERNRSQPFFLHVNFTAPHDPLFLPPGMPLPDPSQQPPLPKNFRPQHPFDHGNLRGRDELLLPFPRTPEAVREELAVYYKVIEELDRQVGRILQTLDDLQLASNTIVIFASDHGLAIGSHGLRGKQNMYEHTINVPLIFRGPGISSGKQLGTQCYLRDLYPTVCEMTGVETPTLDGKSLVPALQERTKEIHPFIVGYFGDSQRMIREGHWKLIHYPRLDKRQLFNIGQDPDELQDLSLDERNRSTVIRLQKQLDDWLRTQMSPDVN